ncbi:MAG: hypothetical protein D6737_02405 [Chloroflexi bacterium]|nr:MAG: hypothetical protein CUN54_03225 [Phototrophicales bacterium]RMF82285.1 MAG: hypothetical protein D6737_02405 [Chloroflexota bacterium]
MRQLTIERSAVIILFALLFALATRVPIDSDTWWHIRSGEHILNEEFIRQDPFSFTKFGEDWVNHSWGSQIVIFAVWEIAGNFGLAIYTALLATAGMAVLFRISAGSVYLRMFVLVIGAATAAIFWSPRPQMMSFFLSTIVLYILYLYKRRGIDRLWLLPIVMMLWGNLHAGFSIGFILMGGVIAGEIINNLLNRDEDDVIPISGIRKLIVISLISAVALVINPYGPKILLVPFQTASLTTLQNFIQEWNSPNFHERQTWPFIILTVALILAVGNSRKRLDWTDFILVSGTFFMALLAGRNIAVYAVAATPVVAYYLDATLKDRGWVLRTVKRPTRRMTRINAVLVSVIVLASLAKVLVVLDTETVTAAQEQFLPVHVAEYLNEHQPPGPIFNSYNWGGYLMFAAPSYPVFVDGRTDLYGDEFLTTYLQTARAGDNWRETLDEFGINSIVVEVNSGLGRAIREEPGWRLDYEDEMAVVFVRERGMDDN